MSVRKLESGGYHVEVRGCVLNIREGLHDRQGREVTAIEILPDDHYSGEPKWRLFGAINNRVVKLKTVRC
jgi:hypothetical protein